MDGAAKKGLERNPEDVLSSNSIKKNEDRLLSCSTMQLDSTSPRAPAEVPKGVNPELLLSDYLQRPKNKSSTGSQSPDSNGLPEDLLLPLPTSLPQRRPTNSSQRLQPIDFPSSSYSDERESSQPTPDRTHHLHSYLPRNAQKGPRTQDWGGHQPRREHQWPSQNSQNQRYQSSRKRIPVSSPVHITRRAQGVQESSSLTSRPQSQHQLSEGGQSNAQRQPQSHTQQQQHAAPYSGSGTRPGSAQSSSGQQKQQSSSLANSSRRRTAQPYRYDPKQHSSTFETEPVQLQSQSQLQPGISPTNLHAPSKKSDTEWACRRCTFINRPNNKQCEMCETPNINLENATPHSPQQQVLAQTSKTSQPTQILQTSQIQRPVAQMNQQSATQAIQQPQITQLLPLQPTQSIQQAAVQQLEALQQSTGLIQHSPQILQQMQFLQDQACALAQQAQQLSSSSGNHTQAPTTSQAPSQQGNTPEKLWREVKDKKTGYVYYWNKKTGAVTWTKPRGPGVHIRRLNDKKRPQPNSLEQTPAVAVAGSEDKTASVTSHKRVRVGTKASPTSVFTRTPSNNISDLPVSVSVSGIPSSNSKDASTRSAQRSSDKSTKVPCASKKSKSSGSKTRYDWKEHFNEAEKLIYFHNKSTAETTYILPPSGTIKKLPADVRKRAKASPKEVAEMNRKSEIQTQNVKRTAAKSGKSPARSSRARSRTRYKSHSRYRSRSRSSSRSTSRSSSRSSSQSSPRSLSRSSNRRPSPSRNKYRSRNRSRSNLKSQSSRPSSSSDVPSSRARNENDEMKRKLAAAESRLQEVEREKESLQISMECVICAEVARKRMKLSPCNHSQSCSDCGKELTNCPICMAKIVSKEVIFI